MIALDVSPVISPKNWWHLKPGSHTLIIRRCWFCGSEWKQARRYYRDPTSLCWRCVRRGNILLHIDPEHPWLKGRNARMVAKGLNPNGQPLRGCDPEKLKARQLRARLKLLANPRGWWLCRLQGALRSCLKKNEWGRSSLPWTPAALRTHIEERIQARDGCCPLCGTPLDRFHIDHKRPLKLARTKEEVLALFALENLDVLCPSCNMSKRATIIHY